MWLHDLPAVDLSAPAAGRPPAIVHELREILERSPRVVDLSQRRFDDDRCLHLGHDSSFALGSGAEAGLERVAGSVPPPNARIGSNQY
jgi:hypothetical protein